MKGVLLDQSSLIVWLYVQYITEILVSIFKPKSNIRTVVSVTTTMTTTNEQPGDYRASPDFLIDGWTVGKSGVWQQSSSVGQYL